MRGFFRAQGATEYLVLLAVVLIIALIGVALLGFFPGTATDAQVAESQLYWRSASPIAVVEFTPKINSAIGGTAPYMRLRNNGPYQVRITKLLAGSSSYMTRFGCTDPSICTCGSTPFLRDYFVLQPGEETYLATWYTSNWGWCGKTRDWEIVPNPGSGDGGNNLYSATSVCQKSADSPGAVEVRNFGFEYELTIEGQTITKRQIGTKPLLGKCVYFPNIY